MKIAIIGTHGIGKTTLVTRFHLYALMKNISAKVISEVARDCPLGINENFNLNSAIWIISQQISRELNALSKDPTLIICDRSSIDPIAYLQAKLCNMQDSIPNSLQVFAESWLPTYDRIIWIRPSGKAIRNDGVRDVNVNFQNLVDSKFKTQMDKFKTKFPNNIEEFSSDSLYNKNCDVFFDLILGGI